MSRRSLAGMLSVQRHVQFGQFCKGCFNQAHGGQRQTAAACRWPVNGDQCYGRGFAIGLVGDPPACFGLDQRCFQPEPRLGRATEAGDGCAQQFGCLRRRCGCRSLGALFFGCRVQRLLGLGRFGGRRGRSEDRIRLYRCHISIRCLRQIGCRGCVTCLCSCRRRRTCILGLAQPKLCTPANK